MEKALIKDKHLKLNQYKLARAKEILRAKTETETIEKALDLVLEREESREKRKGLLIKILKLREQIGPIEEDVAEWIRNVRKEREESYGL